MLQSWQMRGNEIPAPSLAALVTGKNARLRAGNTHSRRHLLREP